MPTRKPHRSSGEAILARLETEARSLGMNRTESRFAEHLELLKLGGLVAWYGFEALSVKMSKKTRYTPDFAVLLADGRLVLVECKATWRHKTTKKPIYGWREASKVRFETASSLFPMFLFRAVRPGLKVELEAAWVEYDPAGGDERLF